VTIVRRMASAGVTRRPFGPGGSAACR
jgi:hypothetical protein